MRYEFIDEEISVSLDESKPGRPPSRFVWRKEEYQVDSIEAVWHDKGFGPLRHGPKRWWQRRHRTCYQVASRGEIYELYHDRGLGRWTLLRRIAPGESDKGE